MKESRCDYAAGIKDSAFDHVDKKSIIKKTVIGVVTIIELLGSYEIWQSPSDYYLQVASAIGTYRATIRDREETLT